MLHTTQEEDDSLTMKLSFIVQSFLKLANSSSVPSYTVFLQREAEVEKNNGWDTVMKFLCQMPAFGWFFWKMLFFLLTDM